MVPNGVSWVSRLPMPWRSILLLAAVCLLLYVEYRVTTLLRRMKRRPLPGTRLFGVAARASIVFLVLSLVRWGAGLIWVHLRPHVLESEIGSWVIRAEEWITTITAFLEAMQ